MRAPLGLSLTLLLSACTAAPYPCTSNAQCVRSGTGGHCIAVGSEAYCAFYDQTCPSRWRFDESAGPAALMCSGMADMQISFTEDGGGPADLSLAGPCEPGDPHCRTVEVAAPFALQADAVREPRETDTGLDRDGAGRLIVKNAPSPAPYLYIGNSFDWNKGTVSKVDSKGVREVARYFSITCSSLKSGSRDACDGQKGCCSLDDPDRFAARQQGGQGNGHVALDLEGFQNPDETAVDASGDALVSNRGQSGRPSISRIAGDPSRCIDRNGNGKIETSADVNGDGQIQTDCNNDSIADDIATVRKTPCANGLGQEFYGYDDECVLWTSVIGPQFADMRALALAPGNLPLGPLDAWTANNSTGVAYRMSSTSGLLTEAVTLPNGCSGDTIVVDAGGIAWAAPRVNGVLCYFDTHNTRNTGKVRDPNVGQLSAFGLAIDRDQNLWMGGYLGSSDAFRYTPVRDKGFAQLGGGRWVHLTSVGKNGGAVNSGQGIASDSRSATQYFLWMANASGHLVRLPGSDLEKMLPKMGDATLDGSAFPAVFVGGFSASGVGIDPDQNVWVVSSAGNGQVIRVKVDAKGNMTQPNLGQPVGKLKCPGGDRCVLADGKFNLFPVTDGDMGGFSLRNFTRPRTGVYTWVQEGCVASGGPAQTEWFSLAWDAEMPSGATVAVRARTGNTPTPDVTWGPYTAVTAASPLDLRQGLMGNDVADGYLQVELTLSTANVTPALRLIRFQFRCP